MKKTFLALMLSIIVINLSDQDTPKIEKDTLFYRDNKFNLDMGLIQIKSLFMF